jgi:hypothetical protein
MKFTIERTALERMVEQVKIEGSGSGMRQRIMRLSACAARVFEEANGVVAGTEALVLEDGSCNVPRMKFLKVLRTFHPKAIVTLEADGSGLRIENFGMEATCFSPVAVPPAEFHVFPVTDAWVAPSKAPASPGVTEPDPATDRAAPAVENRWLKSRWWE